MLTFDLKKLEFDFDLNGQMTILPWTKVSEKIQYFVG